MSVCIYGCRKATIGVCLGGGGVVTRERNPAVSSIAHTGQESTARGEKWFRFPISSCAPAGISSRIGAVRVWEVVFGVVI